MHEINSWKDYIRGALTSFQYHVEEKYIFFECVFDSTKCFWYDLNGASLISFEHVVPLSILNKEYINIHNYETRQTRVIKSSLFDLSILLRDKLIKFKEQEIVRQEEWYVVLALMSYHCWFYRQYKIAEATESTDSWCLDATTLVLENREHERPSKQCSISVNMNFWK